MDLWFFLRRGDLFAEKALAGMQQFERLDSEWLRLANASRGPVINFFPIPIDTTESRRRVEIINFTVCSAHKFIRLPRHFFLNELSVAESSQWINKK